MCHKYIIMIYFLSFLRMMQIASNSNILLRSSLYYKINLVLFSDNFTVKNSLYYILENIDCNKRYASADKLLN